VSLAPRVSYYDLGDEDRERLHEWCRLHNVVPANTPIDADIRYDPEMHEWVIPQFSTKDGKKYLRNGDIARHVVRRAVKASLPWPAREAGRA
jgi:hypothetical protein